jgi:RNA 3'-terminal phosphate cyclase (ATP)
LACETSTKCVIGGSGLGNRNERANETGAKAASEILKALESQACVDEHVQDQLIIFMALASGESQIRCANPLTLHTQTAIYVSELMSQVLGIPQLFI